MTEQGFLTVGDVAAQLKVSNMTVYRLISTKKLTAIQVGRAYRIGERSLAKYIEEMST